MQRYKSKYTGPQMDVAFERALPGGAIDLSLSNRANGYRGNAQDLGYTKLADIKGDGTYLIVDGPSYLTDYPAFLAARGLRYATLQVCNAVDVYLGKILYAQNAGQTLNAVAAWCGPAGWIDIATATPPAEYDLPLSNVTGTVKYSKSQDSNVLITSLCVTASAALSAGATIATLPAGYYPPWEIKMLADIGGQLGRVIISTAGVVTINKTAAQGAEICTGSISFVAAS